VIDDGGGHDSLCATIGSEANVDEELRMRRFKGVSPFAAVLLLQSRIVALEAGITGALEARIAAAEKRIAALEAGRPLRTRPKFSPTKLLGRRDRVRFGWGLDPHNSKRIVPNAEEQETIRVAQKLADEGLSLREVCRRLDRQGRGRRGKKWENAHGVLRAILRRPAPKGP